MEFITHVRTIVFLLILATNSLLAATPEPPEEFMGLPLLLDDNFDQPEPDKWQPSDPDAWTFTTDGDRTVYALTEDCDYRPEYIAPLNFSIRSDLYVGDCVIDLWLKSTMEDYAHRDMCVFFGWQNPCNFYYIHMGLRSDPRSNTIMIVDSADRANIVQERTDGTPWTNDYHHVRVVRKVDSGLIELYFDDMSKPSMKTVDHTFGWGRIGVGSFDDIGNIDRMVVWGEKVDPPLAIDADVPWVISPDEAGPMKKTIEDIQRDWYKVLGVRPLVLDKMPEKWSGPMLFFGHQAQWMNNLDGEKFSGAESFRIRVTKPDFAGGGTAIVCSGADLRGAMYAAYTFSEKILNVDPWYYWVDRQPPYRSEVYIPQNYQLIEGPPTFKYRGWFINDEDLLGGWARDPMGENVFDIATWDRVYETLLRLRGNMIVPGTFTFPDEKCRELAALRGIALNDHHINVCGLNTFRWPEEIPYSYLKHPDILERAWKMSIEAMKNWEVVWTVGYRGKHDRPFWVDDKSADTPEARGKIISDAIAKQVELIRAVQPKADIITNLWGEGASLYHAGHLTIPEGVALVWPDDGHGLIRDGGKVTAGQGVYYHTMMLNGQANQLTEAVPPRRIFSELGRFVKADATEFFLVNVSDIRPAPLSTDAAMQFVWNAEPFMKLEPEAAEKQFIHNWSIEQFGEQYGDLVAEVYLNYFQMPVIAQRQRGEHYLIHHNYSPLLHKAVEAMRKQEKSNEQLDAALTQARKCVEESREYVHELSKKAGQYRYRVPTYRWDFYRAHVLSQIAIHREVLDGLAAAIEAIEAWQQGDEATAADRGESARRHYDNITAAWRDTEYGHWRGFYENEIFTHYYYIRDLAREFEAHCKGLTVPRRRPPRNYNDLYEYQDAHKDNFPLFYPPERSLNR